MASPLRGPDWGGFDRRRLRLGLVAFFLALALPSAILVYQAFSRLEWEGFHQQQVLAEELAQRLDTRLADLLDAESARGFAEYAFLVVEGDPKAGYLQRSPLSVFPPDPEIPGLIGYFQVDAQGGFSSPLLPRGSIDPVAYGLTGAEIAERGAAERHLEQILSSNRLVDRRRIDGRAPGTANADERGLGRPSAGLVAGSSAGGSLDRQGHMPDSLADADATLDRATWSEEVPGADAHRSDAPYQTSAEKQAIASPATDAQLAFDRLNEVQTRQRKYETAGRDKQKTEQQTGVAATKIQNLARGQRQSRREVGVLPEPEPAATPSPPAAPWIEGDRDNTPLRAKVAPQGSPTEAPVGEGLTKDIMADAEAPERRAPEKLASEPQPPATQRPPIRTFESEIDPFEASRLVGGQLVLYRKVWRDGQRYTQGALIDPVPFVQGLIGAPFRDAALARTSDLAVAWGGEQLALFAGRSVRDYSSNGLRGTPLYQTRLSDPFGDLELAFAVNRLPLGPGANVIAWVATALALVLCGGVYALYRLGLRQIGLVRQQQDFVSAVSHELKTPLTSIRMYSEMLREGWVPEEKRPGYYGFIHDESERLSRLINNVLQLARMTRNEQRLELRPISCVELLDQARSKVASRIDGAGFTLTLAYPPEAGEILVRADPDAFAQILINLVDNAVKFSAKAARHEVEIGCRLLRDRMEFRVRDYGPGVPQDQMKEIFRLFYRAEGALTRETLGTGIGLALVKGLARAMGGSVDLVNRDPGAEFRLILPAQAAGPLL